MATYAIRRDDGAYVARPGLARSYTRSLDHVWLFRLRDEASRNACGNESVVEL